MAARRKRVCDRDFFHTRWTKIEELIWSVFRSSPCRNSFQSVHHSLFQLCQAGYDSLLLDGIDDVLRAHADSLLKHLIETSNDDLLAEYAVQWVQFDNALRRVSGFLLYLDSNYLHKHRRHSIEECGEHMFCTQVMLNEMLKTKLKLCVSQAVYNAGKWTALREYTSQLIRINHGRFFGPFFEEAYLEQVIEKYAKESEMMRQTIHASSFVRFASGVIEREARNASQLTGPTLAQKVTTTLHAVLIRANIDYILNSQTGCIDMLKKGHLAELQHVTTLFQNIGESERVLAVACEFVKSEATLALNLPSTLDVSRIVDEIQKLIAKAQELTSLFSNFCEHSKHSILRTLFDSINNCPHFVESLSVHVDHCMRRVKSEELSKLVANVMSLFRVIKDKDAFEVALRNKLAVRLIHCKTDNIDSELFFVSELKKECTTGLVSRLERMITDMQDANEMHNRLMSSIKHNHAKLPIKFHVTVLTSGFWPQFPISNPTLPSSMLQCMNTFNRLYLARHNGRKLSFQLNLGTVVFQLTHCGKTYHVTAQTPFVNVINALNSDDCLSVSELCSISSLNKSDVDAQLNVLHHASLVKFDGATYCFNNNFSSVQDTIELVPDAHRVCEKANSSSTPSSMIDQTHIRNIDAALVKSLKKSDGLDFDSLCSLVADTLRHVTTPSRATIKCRIEVMIEKGFIARGSRAGLYFFRE